MCGPLGVQCWRYSSATVGHIHRNRYTVQICKQMFALILCDVTLCTCVIACTHINGSVENIPVLFLLQMAFLHLWHKGGCPREKEGQKAKEELKVWGTHTHSYLALCLSWHLYKFSGLCFKTVIDFGNLLDLCPGCLCSVNLYDVALAVILLKCPSLYL